MSNQTHKLLVKDLAKKRREYLRNSRIMKVSAIALALLGILPLPWTVSVLIFTLRNFSPYQHFGKSLTALIVSAFLILFALWCGTISGLLIRKANTLSHVPPVREQLADVPAEEVLLRGSDQPAAASNEMLRAARLGVETDAEELLRAESKTT